MKIPEPLSSEETRKRIEDILIKDPRYAIARGAGLSFNQALTKAFERSSGILHSADTVLHRKLREAGLYFYTLGDGKRVFGYEAVGYRVWYEANTLQGSAKEQAKRIAEEVKYSGIEAVLWFYNVSPDCL